MRGGAAPYTPSLSPLRRAGSPAFPTPPKRDRWMLLRSRRGAFLLAAACLTASALFLFSPPRVDQSALGCPSPLNVVGADAALAAVPRATITVTEIPATTVTATAPAVTQTFFAPLDPVVFSLVMFHEDSAIEGAVLMKTAIMYTSRPVEFHVICDHGAQAYLEKRLQLLTHPVHDILVRFYLLSAEGMAGRIMREGSIGTDHSAGYPGLMKLFIHELLPEVEKSIFVDTDAFFMADPALLYDEFAHMNGTIAISMPSHPEQGAAHWHYASNICSCIMLLDLAKLRALPLMDSSLYRDAPSADRPVAAAPPTFEALYGAPGADGRYRDVALGDQGYWWAIVSNRTDLYRPLPHDWEVTSCLLDMYGTGLGNDAATEEDERPAMHNTDNVILPKLAHFNCLHDIYFEWDGWFDADNSLTQRWGSALDYHAGFKWIWLNRGSAALRIETVADPVFTDQRYAAEKAERTPYHR